MVASAVTAERPFVTFVIPTFHRPDALAVTLDAILAVDHPADLLKVVVVDDGSSSETEAVVRSREGAGVPLNYLPRSHGGAAGARNAGAREAGEGLLIFVDDDIVVDRDHVAAHLRARQTTGAKLVNGEWSFPPDMASELASSAFGRFRVRVEEWVKEGIAKTPLDSDRAEVAAVTACNLSVASEDFAALGGFDETFPYAGSEDQELSLRAEQLGLRMVYDRSIRLLHNDRRMDLRGFCERQRRGAVTAVVLASKHPHIAPDHAMIVENAPGPWRADPSYALKRGAKRALATKPGTAIVHRVVSVVEKLGPNARLVDRLYWMMTGIYIFAGVREGFDRIPADSRSRLLAELADA